MFEWLAANLATIIVSLVILAAVVLVIRKMIRDKKRGKGGCSWGGDCGSCGACGVCHNSSPAHGK